MTEYESTDDAIVKHFLQTVGACLLMAFVPGVTIAQGPIFASQSHYSRDWAEGPASYRGSRSTFTESNALPGQVRPTWRADPLFYDHQPHLRNAWRLPFGILWSERSLTNTALLGTDDEVGFWKLEQRSRLTLERYPAFSIFPQSARYAFDSPRFLDLPDHVSEFSVGLMAQFPIDRDWTVNLEAAIGLYSDFENFSGDAWRTPAEISLQYRYSQDLVLVGGVAYLDRDDLSALPVFGVIVRPSTLPRLEADLIFPKPEIRYLVTADSQRRRVAYLKSELGGGSWQFQRSAGNLDVLSYRDWRVALGWKHVIDRRFSWSVEAGIAFARQVKFRSGRQFDFGETTMIRARISY